MENCDEDRHSFPAAPKRSVTRRIRRRSDVETARSAGTTPHDRDDDRTVDAHVRPHDLSQVVEYGSTSWTALYQPRSEALALKTYDSAQSASNNIYIFLLHSNIMVISVAQRGCSISQARSAKANDYKPVECHWTATCTSLQRTAATLANQNRQLSHRSANYDFDTSCNVIRWMVTCPRTPLPPSRRRSMQLTIKRIGDRKRINHP